jgi:hypothetical protein
VRHTASLEENPLCSEGKTAIGGLIIFSFWIFVALPFLHGNISLHPHRPERPMIAGDSDASSVALARGAKPESPLFVEVTCNSEIQHSECNEGWFAKLVSDPNATFAMLVAAFTAGLFWLGLQQNKINRRQTTLTETLELPIAIVSAIKLVAFEGVHGPVILPDPVPAGRIPFFCRALVLINNAGRSPMTITRWCIEWVVQPQLPEEPAYIHSEVFNLIVPEHQATWIQAGTAGDIELTPAQRDAVMGQRSHLWIYGYFTYRDFRGKSFDVGFLARWDIQSGLVREPAPNYEYQRKA